MTLWCALKSPLLLGNNLTSMSQKTLDIVGNTALLALNQDPLGKAALRVHVGGWKQHAHGATNTVQIWAGPLSNNEALVVLLNTGEEPATIVSTWAMLAAAKPRCTNLSVTDLWDGSTTSYGIRGPAPTRMLQPHASKALRLACHK